MITYDGFVTKYALVVSDRSAENEIIVSDAPVDEEGRQPEEALLNIYPEGQGAHDEVDLSPKEYEFKAHGEQPDTFIVPSFMMLPA